MAADDLLAVRAELAELRQLLNRSGVAIAGQPFRHGSNAHDPRQNFSATTAPTANDDSAGGYGPGSIWVDRTAGRIYICTNGTVGAAVWRDVSLLYSVHQYAFRTPQDSATDVAAGTDFDPGWSSGPAAEIVKSVLFDAPTAGTGLTYTIAYADTKDRDTAATWTTIHSKSVGSGVKGDEVVSGFSASVVPANRLLRCSLSALSGSYRLVTVQLEVWRPLQF